MNQEDIVTYFSQTMQEDPDKSEAVAAIQTLIHLIEISPGETLVELRKNILEAIDTLTKSDYALTASIRSGSELFLRFVTLTSLDNPDFQECKKIMVERGHMFLNKLAPCRKKIARLAHPFITDGCAILIHSRSRVVLEVFKEATNAKKRFTVYVTESMPDKAGYKMCRDLEALGIPGVVILDSAMGYILEKIDLVLVGAEGVVENGGIINKIGTYTMALSAKEMNIPFYVVAESFKFARLFPLNQRDVPDEFKYPYSKLAGNSDLSQVHPGVDYTPPAYITLLFTDLGVLTPSAVSDELIKLYL